MSTAPQASSTVSSPSPQPPSQPPPPRPLTPLPSVHHPYHYPSHPLSLRPPSQPHNQQIPSKHDQPPHPILYPSARDFNSNSLRPDQIVTIANPSAFPNRSLVSYPRPPTPQIASPHLDPVHFLRPPYSQQQLPHVAPGAIRGIHTPVPPPKGGPSTSSVPQSNGHKNPRDRSRDESLITLRNRKVRITNGTSLYALCRSWLRNGVPEDPQRQFGDIVKYLPQPLPQPVTDNQPKRREDEEQEKQEEEEESISHLSAQDLLKRHVKRAKRVRAKLREERAQRIARYKTRLALLLPPHVEQFQNDGAGGD